MVKNRLSNIKTQIFALEDKSDLNVSEKATLQLFIQEAKTYKCIYNTVYTIIIHLKLINSYCNSWIIIFKR